MFARASFAKESVKRVIATTNSLVGRHLTIWLDAVLKAIEFPAGVTHLDAPLANVERDDFAHGCWKGA